MPLPAEQDLPELHALIAEAALAAISGLSGSTSDIDESEESPGMPEMEPLTPSPVTSTPQGMLIEELLDAEQRFVGAALAHAPALRLSRMSIELPTEFEVAPDQDRDDRVLLRAAPPTQWTRTSVLPALHRIRVTITSHQPDELATQLP